MQTRTPYSLVALAALAALALAGCDKKTAEETAKKPPESAAHGDHAAPAAAGSGDAKAPADAGVYFVFPQDGSKVFATSKVVFGVRGMTVTPAGEHMGDKTRGHHHLIIDGEPVPAGQVVPSSDKHIHFGKGQTETEVKLEPGKHTLTMQFADGAHISYGPALSKTITVEVLPDPDEKKVFFENLKDGDKVKSPVEVKFGLKGFKLRPAGEDALDKTTGHHHIVIDGKPVPLGQMVPTDERHIHFGKAQTETKLELQPGKHTLTLQLADGAHTSYGEELSATVTIEVEP